VNPEQRKQAIMLAVLGVALAGVLVWQLRGGGSEGKQPTRRSESSRKASEATGELAIRMADVNIEELVARVRERVYVDFAYEEHRLPRDPMRPLVGDAAAGPMLPQIGEKISREAVIKAVQDKVVSGIVWDERDPCAIIDNEVVFRGQQFPLGIVLVDIQPDHVTFQRGDVVVSVGLKEW